MSVQRAIQPTCEYCHRQTDDPVRDGWDLIYQCYLCPACIEMAKQDEGSNWLFTTSGGAYAFGRKDPRATVETRP